MYFLLKMVKKCFLQQFYASEEFNDNKVLRKRKKINIVWRHDV